MSTEQLARARVLHRSGQVREAEKEYRAVLSHHMKRDERFHETALTAWRELGLLLSTDGRAAEAVTIFETTTEWYSQEYGLNHPDTLRSRTDLAVVQFRRGQFAAAAALHTSVLTEREHTAGPAARATVESRQYLAGTLARLGRADEAEALLRRNVAVLSDAPMARAALADLLFQLDRLPEALAEFAAVDDQQGQAGVLFALARYDEAAALYRTLRLPKADPNHWLVRVSVEHVRAARGDAEGAVVEIRALLDGCRTQWGPASPVTRAALLVLGDVLLMADQPAAAVPVFDEAIELLTRTCGAHDSMTLCARHMVGAALLRVGQIDEAEQEFLAAAAREDRPPSHSCALASRQGMARVAAARGEFTVAAAAHAEVVAGLTALYGPDHPNTLDARFDAANLLKVRANRTKAHRDILEARLRVLGPNHPDTHKSQSALRD